jgi:hypothetical protein
MNNQQQNMARQSVRYDVSIRACAMVGPEHHESIRFGAGAGARDGWVDLDIVDFSHNGVGLISPVFIPRRTQLIVRAYSYGENPQVVLEVPVCVQRVCMTDRRPAYLIGTAFHGPDEKALQQIASLLATFADDKRAEGVAA